MFEVIKVVVLFIICIYACRWMYVVRCSKETRLIFWIVFVRFVLASFHYASYAKLIGPFSLVSLYSIALVIFLFVYFILNGIKIRTDASFFCIGGVLSLMLISAVINSHVVASVASIVKWLLLLQLINLVLYALEKDGWNKVLLSIGFAYLYPILMLLLSIFFGVSKATENDGSTSYVGGFSHEAVFSVMIFSGMSIYLIRYFLKDNARGALFCLGITLVLLSFINYRTTILAFLGLGAVVGLMVFVNLSLLYKVILSVGVSLLFVVLISFDLSMVADRFNEIPEVLSMSSNFKVFPEYFSVDERRYFSGRIYFWSLYVSEALEGTTLQVLFGHGMDSWKVFFEKYAHNTFVSFFYELGFFGVITLIVFFIALFVTSLKGRDENLSYLLCGLLFAFFILNIATMPLWQIEGIIFLSVLVSMIEFNRVEIHSVDRVRNVSAEH